jgi:transcriptional regulator with XRE-family HTH domain
MSNQFGKSLRAARAAAGMTQENLAKAMRMHPVHLSKLERGERLPSYGTLRRMAKVLPRAAVWDLLTG